MSDITETTGTTKPTAQRVMPDPTTRVRVSDGDALDVWVMGEGPPVVFVHGATMRDFLVPLAGELTRRGDHQVVHFGRRGHGGRGLPQEATDIPGQAEDVVTILDALGIDKAHVAGHSFGAFIALEAAARAPDRLLSALLLELIFGAQLRGAVAQQTMKDMGEVVLPAMAEKYASGDRDGAIEMFYEVTSGIKDAREPVEAALPPGAPELAVTDLATFLQVDGPAMGAWMATADPATVREITTPITWIGATDSPPIFVESRALLQEWLPTATAVDIAGVGHYFPLLKPAETATAVHDWLSSRTTAR
ncbi:alpha/beta fold hydrolase [Streptomyces sp. NPDC002851]